MTLTLAKRLSLYWVDAFTRTAFTGNPAVVVPEAEGLSETEMQQLAREVNCSETAFISSPSQPEADLRLRWFTPTTEVNLCGHATVAALHVLAEQGRFKLKPGATQILYLETRSGILAVTVDYSQETAPWIWLTLPSCDFQPLEPAIAAQLYARLNFRPSANAPTPVVDSLNQDVLIAIASLEQLHQLQPDLVGLARLGQEAGWRGICVYTTETVDPDSLAHSRFFAPHCGIAEDPVTGSVSGPLALYLQQSYPLKSTAPLPAIPSGPALNPTHWVTLEQGDCLGRPGRLLIDLSGPELKMGGQAITVIRGELSL